MEKLQKVSEESSGSNEVEKFPKKIQEVSY